MSRLCWSRRGVGDATTQAKAFVRLSDIVVEARDSSGKLRASVSIPVSTDAAQHGWLAVAKSTARNMEHYTYMDSFWG